MIAGLFLAIEMALQLRIHVLFPKHLDQPFDTSLRLFRALRVLATEGFRDWTIKSASQTDQSSRMRCQLFCCDYTLTRLCVFWHTQFHQRDQATEILITLSSSNPNGYGACVLHAYLRTDVRLDSVFLCRKMKPWRAVNSIAVQQCHGRHLQRQPDRDQLFRHRSTF